MLRIFFPLKDNCQVRPLYLLTQYLCFLFAYYYALEPTTTGELNPPHTQTND
jgi:hypothetical protein